jgi:hypothetical protein
MTSPDMLAILARGNISSLSEEDRTRYILALCDALGLDPRFKPIDLIPGQGGALVPYLNRGATDALARRDKVQRITVVQPKVVTIGSVECVLCVSRATMPDGRYEERVATSLLRDHANAYMKVETKAYRRATIAVLGIGMLDESELDGIRGADALAETARAQALQAHVEAATQRIAMELPSLSQASKEEKAEAWKRHRAQLAEAASITIGEAQAVLLAAVKR